MSQQIVIGLGPVPAELVTEILRDDVTFIPEPTDADKAQAVGAIVRAAVTVGEAELDAMPHLKVIARTGVGTDDVDVADAKMRGITVAIAPGANTNAVAEGALAHLLALTKNLAAHTALVRESRWAERNTIAVGDLEGATLGIVGYGRIGQRVAFLASAFGMKIRAFDPVVPIPDDIRCDSLEDLLQVADAVSLHLPLLDSTYQIINSSTLALMKPGALLVNVSRGGLLDHDAVLEALTNGKLSGVGLDAFDPEPAEDHPLFHQPNVTLTPHMMGLSKRAASATYIEAARAVRAVLDGEAPFAAV